MLLNGEGLNLDAEFNEVNGFDMNLDSHRNEAKPEEVFFTSVISSSFRLGLRRNSPYLFTEVLAAYLTVTVCTLIEVINTDLSRALRLEPS